MHASVDGIVSLLAYHYWQFILIQLFVKHTLLNHLMGAGWAHTLHHIVEFKSVCKARTAGHRLHVAQSTLYYLKASLRRHWFRISNEYGLLISVFTPRRILIQALQIEIDAAIGNIF